MSSHTSKADSALHLALIKVLRCCTCPICGQPKEQKQCFCKTCYFALPAPLRNLLYTKVDGSGEFEDYYLKAMRDLKRRGFIRPMNTWSAAARQAIRAAGLIEALKERAA